jgi:nicotinamide-nucleotide amidase
MSEEWVKLAAELGEHCIKRGIVIAGAESCTGGLICAAITSVSGSSAWFDRGYVTYSNDAKMQMLGVSAKTLDVYGAVSEETAREMALGALTNSTATHTFSVTGIAGPSGGTPQKPVGMVCFGFAEANRLRTHTMHFKGDRCAVREQSRRFALQILIAMVSGALES